MEQKGRVISAQELADRYFENEEKLATQVYIEDEHIVIKVSYEYNIGLSRCDTPDKILWWVDHLCEKKWITLPILRRFIRLAKEHHNLTDPTV